MVDPTLNKSSKPTKTDATPATAGWRLHRRMRRPARKSPSASWRRIGNMATITPTCHLVSPSKRYWRRRAISRDVPDIPFKYSLIHCLTVMPMAAAERLVMSPENHVILSQTAQSGAEGPEDKAVEELKPGWVEFMNGPLTVKLASCAEMVARRAKEGSDAGG